MKNYHTVFYSILFLIVGCACPEKPVEESNSDWISLNRVAKTIDNITYIFPADVSIELRDSAIQMSETAIQENLDLIGETEYTDTIKFEFVHTRDDMELASGYNVKGLAVARQHAMYSLLDLSESSPIKHELMHMITHANWRGPYRSTLWINEGLATYAGKMCGKENFAELYYYYLTNNLLISIDDLTNQFYQQDEIIGYSQGAYMVKHLSETYGWGKIKELWLGGFSQFETIYGKPYTEVEKEIEEKLMLQFPNGVEVDWETVKQGCPN